MLPLAYLASMIIAIFRPEFAAFVFFGVAMLFRLWVMKSERAASGRLSLVIPSASGRGSLRAKGPSLNRDMKSLRLVRLIAVVTLLFCGFLHAQQRSFADELKACAAASDIYGEHDVPHRIEVRFEFPDAQGHKLVGTATELWEAEHRWRREERLGSLHWVQVDAPNGTWILKASGPEPIPVGRAMAIAETCSADSELSNQSTHPPKVTKRGGRELTCYRSSGAHEGFDEEFCFDTSNGTLVSEKRFGDQTTYLEYVDFHGKLVPTRAEIKPNGRVAIKVSLQVKELGTVDPAAFVGGGPDFELKERCTGALERPKPNYAPDPEYTEAARRDKVQGTAVLQLDLPKDGLPRNIVVLQHLPDGLDEEALKAVRQWRFQPAMCDGRPFPMTFNVEVSFRLF